MQFALFAVSLPIYCRWHNLIIYFIFFFLFVIYAKFEFNVQRVLFNYYMRFLSLSIFPSFGHVTHVYNLTAV